MNKRSTEFMKLDNRTLVAVSKLTRELMKFLTSLRNDGHYLIQCQDYAKAVIENDLYYDQEAGRYFNLDSGDDIEIRARQSKTGNPVTIDISDI